MESGKNGTLVALILPDGRSITLKVRPRTRAAFTRRKPAVGSGRLFNAPTTVVRRGSNLERRPASRLRRPTACQRAKVISLFTTLQLRPANRLLRINGMTASRTLGSLNESGI